MATAISWGKRQFVHVEIRHVSMFRSLVWVRKGWDDLRHLGAASVAQGGLIAVAGAVLLMLGSSHPYLIAAAVSGYLLIGPIMTSGLCELSRRRTTGAPLGFDESLEGFTRNRSALLEFGAVLAAFAVLWVVASEMLLRTLLHSSGPTLGTELWGGFLDAASRPQILAYIGVGALLAAIVFTVSVVSIPLIIDRHASATDAMWASLRAALWNLPAMLIWSALIVILTALGFATLLLGMVIVVPLLGHATWHAYKDLVV